MTDRRRLSGDTRCLLRQARAAIDAGIDILQIRERDLEAAELHELVKEIVAMARGSQCRVVVNDRLDVAIASGAAGVHLRGDSMPPGPVRRVAPRGLLIGRSVHGVEEAVAVAADVDYLIAGTVWRTESKEAGRQYPLLGPEGLAAIAAKVRVPVVAIGGVTLDRISAVRAAGAAGVAAIGLFMGDARGGECRAIPLQERVAAIRLRFDTSRRAS